MQLVKGFLGTCCLSSHLYSSKVRAAYVQITVYSPRYCVVRSFLSQSPE